jgi:hypothetical protein
MLYSSIGLYELQNSTTYVHMTYYADIWFLCYISELNMIWNDKQLLYLYWSRFFTNTVPVPGTLQSPWYEYLYLYSRERFQIEYSTVQRKYSAIYSAVQYCTILRTIENFRRTVLVQVIQQYYGTSARTGSWYKPAVAPTKHCLNCSVAGPICTYLKQIFTWNFTLRSQLNYIKWENMQNGMYKLQSICKTMGKAT